MLNIGRHYIISSGNLQNQKKKTVSAHISKFCSAYGVNICSVNLDREIAFLTLRVEHRRRVEGAGARVGRGQGRGGEDAGVGAREGAVPGAGTAAKKRTGIRDG